MTITFYLIALLIAFLADFCHCSKIIGDSDRLVVIEAHKAYSQSVGDRVYYRLNPLVNKSQFQIYSVSLEAKSEIENVELLVQVSSPL